MVEETQLKFSFVQEQAEEKKAPKKRPTGVQAAKLALCLAQEIGTPLGVIRGRAELLMLSPSVAEPQEESVDHSVRVILNQVDRIVDFVDTFIEFFKDPVELEKELKSLPLLLQEVLNQHAGCIKDVSKLK